MLEVAFAGTFAASLEARVRAHLGMPCSVTVADEVGVVSRMPELDVLVTMAFTRAMGAAARRLKLVQVPGAGLDRIDRAALPHIFDRFYRVDQARTREEGGSGLGLSIVKQIIEAHGGRVSVQSEVGAGTVLTLIVPDGQLLSTN